MIAQIAGATIGYDDIGEGTPVVFLHAFPLNRTMWAPQTSALAGDWRCIAIDFRGFGESAPTGPFTIDRYADDVGELLGDIGVRRAIIVGLSMGGYVAFALWRRHAPRVRALVLADTRAGADSEEGKAKRREMIASAKSAGAAAVADAMMPGIIGKTTRAKHPELVQEMRTMLERAPVPGLVAALQSMMDRADSVPTLATIDVPTLIVAGEEDVLTPPKESEAMHAAIRGSRLEIIPRAGHAANFERPSAFNHVAAEFLETV